MIQKLYKKIFTIQCRHLYYKIIILLFIYARIHPHRIIPLVICNVFDQQIHNKSTKCLGQKSWLNESNLSNLEFDKTQPIYQVENQLYWQTLPSTRIPYDTSAALSTYIRTDNYKREPSPDMWRRRYRVHTYCDREEAPIRWIILGGIRSERRSELE